VLAQLRAGDHRRPVVEQTGQRAQQPRLALSAFTEQHHVVPGDQGALQLRDHGVLEAEDARPRVAALGQRGQQVFPDFLFDAPLAMPGGLQLADGPGQSMRLCHHSTLRRLSTGGMPSGGCAPPRADAESHRHAGRECDPLSAAEALNREVARARIGYGCSITGGLTGCITPGGEAGCQDGGGVSALAGWVLWN
jgi:hypothetical protein